MNIFLAALLIAVYSMGCTKAKRYDKLVICVSLSLLISYELWEITPTTRDELATLRRLADELGEEVDFWTESAGVNRSAEVLVAPGVKQQLATLLTDNALRHSLKLENVQRLIDEERPSSSPNHPTRRRQPVRGVYDEGWVDRFHSMYEINAYLLHLATQYPSLVTLIRIGRSHEGRDINVLKVTGRSRGAKRAVYIDGGMHAREWIAPATVLYFIDALTTRWQGQTLFDDIDWYLLPVANPDGYVYSWEEDRMWRKNRSPMACTGAVYQACCRGVDLNRNFDWHFGTAGSSSSACSPIYSGGRAFSEPETSAIRDFVLSHRETISVFISLHGYGQFWFLPYGHAPGVRPVDYESRLLPAAREAVQRLKSVYGTQYEVGTGADLMYSASGASFDWAKGRAGIDYTFLLELRPTIEGGVSGMSGFLLPPHLIRPTGIETFAAVVSVVQRVRRETKRSFERNDILSSPHRSPPLRPPPKEQQLCLDRHSFCRWWTLMRPSICTAINIRRMCQRACGLCSDL